jgi:hypothetical protein
VVVAAALHYELLVMGSVKLCTWNNTAIVKTTETKCEAEEQCLTLSLLMSYIYGAPSKAKNST